MNQEKLEVLTLKHLVQNLEVEEMLKRDNVGLAFRYFEKVPAQRIIKFLFKYYTEYKEFPHSSKSLLLYAKKDIRTFKEPMQTWCRDLAHKIYQKPIPEEKFELCVETLKKNWQKKTGVHLLIEAGEKLDKNDYEGFINVVKNIPDQINVIDTVITKIDPIFEYSQVKKNLEYKASHKELFQGIMSGIPWLDRQLEGYRRGESYVLFAYTGRGKSFFTTQVAYHARKSGFNVVKCELEMSAEKASHRFLSRLTGIEHKKLANPWLLTNNDFNLLTEKVREWKQKKGNLDFLSFDKPPTVSDIRVQLNRLPYSPDFLIVDQITNMSGLLDWQELEAISKQFEMLAKSWENEKGLAVLILDQAKTETEWYQVLSKQHLAYGKGVGEHATAIIYLAQTEEDNEKIGRAHV